MSDGCDVENGRPIGSPQGTWSLVARGTVTIAPSTIVEVAVLTVLPGGIPLTLQYVTTSLAIDPSTANVFGAMNPINSVLGGSVQHTYRRNAGDGGTTYRLVFLNGWSIPAGAIAITTRFRSWEVQP